MLSLHLKHINLYLTTYIRKLTYDINNSDQYTNMLMKKYIHSNPALYDDTKSVSLFQESLISKPALHGDTKELLCFRNVSGYT